MKSINVIRRCIRPAKSSLRDKVKVLREIAVFSPKAFKVYRFISLKCVSGELMNSKASLAHMIACLIYRLTTVRPLVR